MKGVSRSGPLKFATCATVTMHVGHQRRPGAWVRDMRKVMTFLVPGGVLALASLLLVRLDAVEGCLDEVSRLYPVLATAIGVAYGLRFDRSSLVLGALCPAMALWSLSFFGSIHDPTDMHWRVAYVSCSVLLPVNLCVLCLLKERGTLTARGIARLLAILAQPLVVGAVAGRDPSRFVNVLERGVIPWGFAEALPLPQVSALAGAVCLILTAVLFVVRGGAREAGFFWAQLASIAALASGPDREVAAFHLGSASLILLVSMVEISHAMAFKDELTGLPGRRALKEELLKLGSEYCLAMVDIDHFKKFNDTYGHDAGDQVLKMVASRLGHVGGGGRAFRYGGEEFTIVFSGRNAQDALEHLEELRKDVASFPFVIRSALRPIRSPDRRGVRSHGRKNVTITISVGAAWPGGSASKPEEVLEAADKALYRAKKRGRNRVES